MSAPAPINPQDIANVIFAARHGLAGLRPGDLVNVANSIAALQTVLDGIAAESQKAAGAKAAQAVIDAAPGGEAEAKP